MRQASIADLHIVVRELERRLTRQGVSVKYVDDPDVIPHATKDSIVLPVLTHPMSEADLQYHRYRALHEIGHHERGEIWDFMARVGKISEQFHYCWNLLEDEALEDQIARRYPGDRITMERGRSYHVDWMGEQFKTARANAPADAPVSGDTIKQVAGYVVALLSRRWHRGVEALVDATLLLCPEARELTDELIAEGWPEKIRAHGTVPEVYDRARELHARLWPEQEQPPESQDVPEKQPDEGEGESSKGDGEGEGDAAQQSEDEESEENQGDADDKDGKPQQNDKEIVIPWNEITGSDHEGMAHCTSKGEEEISYTGWRAQNATFQPRSHFKINRRMTHDVDIAKSRDAGVANQLRRHIQAITRSTWETERTTGRINKRAVKRIRMGTRDYHRRVFQKRNDAPAIDTAITILVDCSGSMACGSRIHHAAAAAAILSETFGRVLKCKVEVLGHSTHCEGPSIVIAKEFGEVKSGEDIQRHLFSLRMAGNADGDALLWSADRLAARPEARKILILLADGMPTDCLWVDGNDPASVLMAAIEATHAMGIETAGIGINHHGIRYFWKDAEIITDADQIGKAVLKTAERFVLKN